MPFLFGQVSSFGYFGNHDGEDWAILREQQALVEQDVPNTGMCLSYDYGNDLNIHPHNKKPIGDRLANLALAKIYQQDVQANEPQYKSHRIVDNKVIIEFSNVGSGPITSDTKAITGFMICAKNRIFFPAQAKILGQCIEVYSESVSVPFAVRFVFTNKIDANLTSQEGIPVRPFRTDIYRQVKT